MTGPMDEHLGPARIEPRGQFPEHGGAPRPVLSRADAYERAARRLAAWKAAHDAQ